MVTDVEGEMCWWQLEDVGDVFDILANNQHSKDVTNMFKSSISSHQHQCHRYISWEAVEQTWVKKIVWLA